MAARVLRGDGCCNCQHRSLRFESLHGVVALGCWRGLDPLKGRPRPAPSEGTCHYWRRDALAALLEAE